LRMAADRADEQVRVVAELAPDYAEDGYFR
jgi:hypothetical protein